MGKSPNSKVLLYSSEFLSGGEGEYYYDVLLRAGVPDSEIERLKGCETEWMPYGDWSGCDCGVQNHPLRCHSPYCWKCADSERKKNVSVLMKGYLEPMFEACGKGVYASFLEATLPASNYDEVVDLNALAKAGERWLYRLLNVDPKKYELGFIISRDVWGEKHVMRGFEPHLHFFVLPFMKDLCAVRRGRSEAYVRVPKVGEYWSHADFKLAREFWREELIRMGVKVTAPTLDVHYGYANSVETSVSVAYAQIYQRLVYQVRRPIFDIHKFITNSLYSSRTGWSYISAKGIIRSKESERDIAWLGRLLNFYANHKRRDKPRPEHYTFNGFLSKRVLKDNFNLFVHTFKRVCPHVNHKDCLKGKDKFGLVQRCPNENFKSWGEHVKASKEVHCRNHPFSIGRCLESHALSFDECVRKYPKSRFVGRLSERKPQWMFPMGL